MLLLNSPTFNTLDNRFVGEQHHDGNRYQNNANHTNEAAQANPASHNMFTDNAWPGLKHDKSEKSATMQVEDGPRIASPNVVELTDEQIDENKKYLRSLLP